MRTRDKRGTPPEHFCKMIRTTMETPAWQALSTAAQSLYPWLKLEWRGPKFNNNGALQLPVRQAAMKLGVMPNTVSSAFHDLQARGFLVITAPARLGIEGDASAPMFEITELPLPHSDRQHGRALYREWRPGRDFPVVKARANNPTGTNRKRNPISKIETAPSQKSRRNGPHPSQK